MKNFFKNHPDFVLIGFAVVFLGVLASYFFWGVTTLVTELNKGVNSGKVEATAVGFNLRGAASLNLKGNLPQSQ